MLAFTSLFSRRTCRFPSRADLELEFIALRQQLAVQRRQRPHRTRISSIDRLLWVWLYRLWPRCPDVIVVLKSATVILMTPNSRDPSFRVCFRRRSPPTSRCHHKWSWMVLSFHYTPVDESFARLYLCPNPPWNPDICEKPPPRKPPKNPLRKPPTGAGTPWGTIDGRGATLNTGAAEEKILGP